MPLTEVSETAVLAVPVARVWEVIDATDRYAEWVVGVLEVTDHHGAATVGRTYSERNRTVGPLTTRSTWTVERIDPPRRRVDTGTGFAPMHDMTNVFELEPVQVDGGEGTRFTYTVRYRPGLGPVGRLIDRLQRPGLRRSFQASMRNLEDLIVAEGPAETA
ncbi:SRPBCC family protein [Frankia sp. CNm7]|uniref:SRPBCC family protein n=1 Tax=Frankia nepalensis TaxID=1836974 RepID=A0A937RCM6_9ACTN|nr:SRPBCC family protein [Frankia nepalensis]MBL7495823.1 SRPBCC family protein [Frankia nepalensis]MBL7509899.1 SRPBCC family protein [Frankia nepalensis]MBL7517634.1 SRPBCC family protein [Frankia nepalensis]MBL7629658.1 SRPBCC family protein [Frankia nepalensis]